MSVYTVKDVAERWKVHTNHVYLLVKSGALPAFRVGGSWRIREDAITAFENRSYKPTVLRKIH